MRRQANNLALGTALAGLLAGLCPGALAGPAGSPGGIFDFGAGARPLAMGGAYAAVARDASAVYYNPAGLSLLGSRNLAFMHAALFEGVSYDYLGYAQNYAALPGGWGAQLLRLSAGGADGRDANNQPTGGFGYSETALAAGTGLHGFLLPALSMGVSAKVLNRTMDGESNRLIGFDIGAQYGALLDERLRLAVVVRNLGSFAIGDTADKLPFGVKLGASYALVQNLALSVDLSDSGELQFGTEYGVGPGAVRLGYDRSSLSFGGGVKFLKAYQLDYAMLKHSDLGLSNRISLNYFFGGVPAKPKIRTYAPDFIKKAEGAIAERDYLAAYTDVNMSIGMDPGVKKGPWGEKHLRLGRVVSGLKLKELPARQKLLKADSEQAKEAGRAVDEYLEGNEEKSALLAHSALGYQPGSAFFSEFLNVMGGLTKNEVKKEEVLPRNALAKEKLRKAETHFQFGEYDKAAKECEHVLLLEPESALAWTRLGSSYFALGDMQRSRQAFVKALQLDPQNQSVRDFMLLQGWLR